MNPVPRIPMAAHTPTQPVAAPESAVADAAHGPAHGAFADLMRAVFEPHESSHANHAHLRQGTFWENENSSSRMKAMDISETNPADTQTHFNASNSADNEIDRGSKTAAATTSAFGDGPQARKNPANPVDSASQKKSGISKPGARTVSSAGQQDDNGDVAVRTSKNDLVEGSKKAEGSVSGSPDGTTFNFAAAVPVAVCNVAVPASPMGTSTCSGSENSNLSDILSTETNTGSTCSADAAGSSSPDAANLLLAENGAGASPGNEGPVQAASLQMQPAGHAPETTGKENSSTPVAASGNEKAVQQSTGMNGVAFSVKNVESDATAPVLKDSASPASGNNMSANPGTAGNSSSAPASNGAGNTASSNNVAVAANANSVSKDAASVSSGTGSPNAIQEKNSLPDHGIAPVTPVAALHGSPASSASSVMPHNVMAPVGTIPAGIGTTQARPAPIHTASDTFAALDSSAAADHGVLLHAAPHQVAVGVSDPALGWVEVRAERVQGQVTAAVTASSAASHQALTSVLPLMATYLQDHHPGVHQLHLDNAFAGHHAGAGSQNGSPAQQHGEGNRGAAPANFETARVSGNKVPSVEPAVPGASATVIRGEHKVSLRA